MSFHSFHQFIAMGGFASYVWTAYGMALFVLVLNLILPIVRRRQLLRKLKQHSERKPAAATSVGVYTNQTSKNPQEEVRV